MSVNTSIQEYIPPELIKSAEEALQKTVPEKSKHLYMKTYEKFISWMEEKNTNSFGEIILLAYFNDLSKTLSPTCLWSRHSMLATMLYLKKGIDIRTYFKVKAFIKQRNIGVVQKKTKVFTTQQVNDFLNNAPDSEYLPCKVALILGVVGACRRDDLYKLSIEHMKQEGSVYIFHLPDTKTNIPKTFTVEGNYAKFITKYVQLRPTNTCASNFFLAYRKGKCTRQVMGVHNLGGLPKQIATYLDLPDPEKYTGHSFRRRSATILSNAGADMTELKRHGGWRSATVAEGYIENSIQNNRKTSNCIMNAIDQDTNVEEAPPTKTMKFSINNNVTTSNENQNSISLNIHFK